MQTPHTLHHVQQRTSKHISPQALCLQYAFLRWSYYVSRTAASVSAWLTGLAHAAGPGHHMCCWQAFPGYAELILIDMVTER